MSVATSTAIAIGGLAAAGGSIAASKIQSGATKSAAQIEKDNADKALDFQKEEYADQKANQAPWMAAGKNALALLESGIQPGGQLTDQYGAFSAPTGVDESNDPGYAFRLAEGQKALERSAAAKGTATGGAALKAAERFGQDYGSNEYNNVYARALQGYQTNYGVWNNGQNNQFNHLASIAGLGQAATGELGSEGAAAAGNTTGIYGNLGNNLANLTQDSGTAAASGVLGATGAINSGVNSYQNYQLMQQLMANQNQSGYNWTAPNASYPG